MDQALLRRQVDYLWSLMSKLHLIKMTGDPQMFKCQLNMIQDMMYLETFMSRTLDQHLTPKILILLMVEPKRLQRLVHFMLNQDRQVCKLSICLGLT